MRILNGYEIYQLDNVEDFKIGDQLWFNVLNCLHKVGDDEWRFQLTGICNFERVSDEQAESIIKSYQGALDDKMQELLDYIENSECKEPFYTGYELSLIKRYLRDHELVQTTETDFTYQGKRFILTGNYNQYIEVSSEGI